jgi:glycosyltransferase involved in cell wall biosynthesis
MVAVSIIVAACRAGGTLARAIASVLEQDMTDWELIVAADDGTDYRDLVTAVAGGDRRLRVTESGGVGLGPSAARNAGLALARGGWVCALDADDSFLPGRLSTLLPVAREHGLATDCVAVVDEGGTLLRHAFPPGAPDRSITPDEIMTCGVPLHPLARRDLVGPGWPPLRFAEDVVFNLQLAERAGAFPVVMQPLYRYVVHPASICHGPDAAAHADSGYEAIVAGLERDAFGFGPALRAKALAGFREKRANNLAFAKAQAKGHVASFQEFMALRDAGDI